MKKAFDFISSLKPGFIELFGYPTVKFYPDFVEVYFDTCSVIRDLSALELSADAFRMYSSDKDSIIICFTFYCDNV